MTTQRVRLPDWARVHRAITRKKDLQGGVPALAVWLPRSGEDGLSFQDGRFVSCSEAPKATGLSSVFGCATHSVSDFLEHGVVPVLDPRTGSPHHVLADYRHITTEQAEVIAQALREKYATDDAGLLCCLIACAAKEGCPRFPAQGDEVPGIPGTSKEPHTIGSARNSEG